MSENVELILDPGSDRFDATDDRWLDQVTLLVSDLRMQLDDVSIRSTSVPGSKGVLDEIVVPLLTSGAIPAAVGVIAAWLQRDTSRSVRVRLAADGSVEEFEMSGADVDDRAVEQMVASLADRFRGAP